MITAVSWHTSKETPEQEEQQKKLDWRQIELKEAMIYNHAMSVSKLCLDCSDKDHGHGFFGCSATFDTDVNLGSACSVGEVRQISAEM